MKGIPSNISDYLIKQLEDKLNSLDTGITVTLYSADGEVLASDQVRVLVTNSDKWYSKVIPNGAFITNKESVPTTVAVGGQVKLEGGVTPLRLGYGVTWSIDTDSIWTSGKDYATIDDKGNVTIASDSNYLVSQTIQSFHNPFRINTFWDSVTRTIVDDVTHDTHHITLFLLKEIENFFQGWQAAVNI